MSPLKGRRIKAKTQDKLATILLYCTPIQKVSSTDTPREILKKKLISYDNVSYLSHTDW